MIRKEYENKYLCDDLIHVEKKSVQKWKKNTRSAKEAI